MSILEPLIPLSEVEDADSKAKIEQQEKLLEDIAVINAADLINEKIDHSLTLLGDRFLCRGGGMFLIGPSGIGKSTLAMGMCVGFAGGNEYLGISPAGPLKILIVQAENDQGDLIEQLQGAFSESQSGLENINFVTINHLTGNGLLGVLEGLIEKYRPDLVMLDCLHAYLGDSPTETVTLSRFLRNGLSPILTRSGAAAIIVHHTPKTIYQDRSHWNPSDHQYAAAGAAEVANWCRAMLVLSATANPKVFELIAAKRGVRLQGELWEKERILIRHSRLPLDFHPSYKAKLAWELADDTDIEQIRRATEKRNGTSARTCSSEQFLSKLPEGGHGAASCIRAINLATGRKIIS